MKYQGSFKELSKNCLNVYATQNYSLKPPIKRPTCNLINQIFFSEIANHFTNQKLNEMNLTRGSNVQTVCLDCLIQKKLLLPKFSEVLQSINTFSFQGKHEAGIIPLKKPIT